MVDGIKREKLYGKNVNSKNKTGKYVKSKISINSNDIAIDATLRAAALRNSSNSNLSSIDFEKIMNIKKEDLREKIRKHGVKLSIALVIDMSGSMLGDEKLSKIKSILQKIIANVQINKDKLAVIGFKGKDSEVIIPNTKRPTSFLDKLENITVGGTTPMAAGLEKGLEILKVDSNKSEYIPMIMVLSDGVTNVTLARSNNINTFVNDNEKLLKGPINDVFQVGEKIAKQDIHTVIVNFEKEKNKGRSVNQQLAHLTGGKFYDLEHLGEMMVENIFEEEPIDKNSFSFGSVKSDLSDMVFEQILDFERESL